MPFQKGNKLGGRPPKSKENAVVRYYEDILPQVFKLVREKLESKEEKDRMWAAEWIRTGIVKLIPQKIGGDPDNRTPIPILGGITIEKSKDV